MKTLKEHIEEEVESFVNQLPELKGFSANWRMEFDPTDDIKKLLRSSLSRIVRESFEETEVEKKHSDGMTTEEAQIGRSIYNHAVEDFAEKRKQYLADPHISGVKFRQ